MQPDTADSGTAAWPVLLLSPDLPAGLAEVCVAANLRPIHQQADFAESCAAGAGGLILTMPPAGVAPAAWLAQHPILAQYPWCLVGARHDYLVWLAAGAQDLLPWPADPWDWDMRLARLQGRLPGAGAPLASGQAPDPYTRDLEEREHLYRRLLEDVPVPIGVFQGGLPVYYNRAAFAFLGYQDPMDLLSKSISNLLLPGEAADFLSQATVPVAGLYQMDARMRRRDGSRVAVRLNMAPVAVGGSAAVMVVMQDVSDRLQADEATASALRRFDSLFEHNPMVAVQGLDRRGRVLHWNRASEALYGYSARFAIGQRLPDFLSPPPLAADLEERLQRTFSTGCVAEPTEVCLLNQHGERIWALATFCPIVEEGEVVEIFAVQVDVTERRQYQDALQDLNQSLEWRIATRTAEFEASIERLQHEIQLRQELEGELNTALAEQQTLFDASPIPILLVADRRVLWASRATERVTGYPLEEIVGHSTEKFYSEEYDYVHYTENLYGRVSSGEIIEEERRFRRMDGQTVTMHMILKAVDASDLTRGTLAIMQDITARKDAEQALIRAKELAEAANQAKSEFLANMSHELRTPMHAILSYSEMGLARLQPDNMEKLAKYLGTIHLSGKRLLALINDLLDLAKLEAGKMRYEFRTEDVRACLALVLRELGPLLKERDLQVEVDMQLEVARAECDAQRISQVLRNLLSNAIKFSPHEGRIVVVFAETALPRDGHHNAGLKVTVRDEGIGIPNDELETVFDKFIQSSATKSKAGGTGLGLAICREIVIQHGGVIMAGNAAGGGAEFSFILPRERLRIAQPLS